MSKSSDKSGRLLHSRDFQKVHAKGCKVSGRWVQLLYLPNSLEGSRLGLAIGRRLGKAVERNRLKRWIREIIRRNRAVIVGGFDVVVLVRPQAKDVEFSAISLDCLDLFSRLKNRKVGSL